jgi:hypothetical protein
VFDRNLFGEDVKPESQGSGLSATWEYPPFSVLSARDGWWQERKRQWLALGIQSELGRGENLSDMGGAIERRAAIKRGRADVGQFPASDGTRIELLPEPRA